MYSGSITTTEVYPITPQSWDKVYSQLSCALTQPCLNKSEGNAKRTLSSIVASSEGHQASHSCLNLGWFTQEGINASTNSCSGSPGRQREYYYNSDKSFREAFGQWKNDNHCVKHKWEWYFLWFSYYCKMVNKTAYKNQQFRLLSILDSQRKLPIHWCLYKKIFLTFSWEH